MYDLETLRSLNDCRAAEMKAGPKKFRVLAQQFIEMVCTVEVEADTPEEARRIALENDLFVAATWVDGADALDLEVYSILDEAGEEVWNR